MEKRRAGEHPAALVRRPATTAAALSRAISLCCGLPISVLSIVVLVFQTRRVQASRQKARTALRRLLTPAFAVRVRSWLGYLASKRAHATSSPSLCYSLR
jgi:hypothetical protein